ncbi:hypothetical protein L596_022947 [Steinernema carpocapsae]|uniref:Nuclear pore complex protein Nup205 n=1 Tax=Steinernema carpocapsae TaxID=34508 RepID=A0A4U5MC54_STECR|nr:hypothetical protein L596_022947 [Steinernema carpocapsae]
MWLEARQTRCALRRAIDELPNIGFLEHLVATKAIEDLLPALKRVLQNNPKNTSDRQKLAGAEVALDDERRIQMNDALRVETAVISDEFDLNEIQALELLLTGEAQYEEGGVGRGLSAVLCYYDTHRYYSQILSMLLTLHGNPDVPEALRNNIDSIIRDRNVYCRLLDTLTLFTVKSELDRLAKPTVNGVGNPRHKRILIDLINDTRSNYFNALYNLCAAVPQDLLASYTTEVFQRVREISTEQKFDHGNLCLWSAAVSFIRAPSLVEYQNPKAVLDVVHDQFGQPWKDTTIAATIHLAYTVGLRSLASRTNMDAYAADMTEEKLAMSIDLMALQFIRDYIITVPGFKDHFAFPHTIDCLLKAMCTFFPEKMNELLRDCDGELDLVEDGGISSLPHLPKFHFRALLEIMTTLYDLGTPEMKAASDNYFTNDCPSLRHFLEYGRQVGNPVLLISYLNMMSSLCNSETTARTIFYFLKRGATNYSTLTWDHLFAALRNYVNVFRNEIMRSQMDVSATKVNMPQSELAGFIAWIQLAIKIAYKSVECRELFLKERGCLESLIGICASPVHTYLKGAVLQFLATFALDFENVNQIWHGLIRSNIVTVENDGALQGIPKELELKERTSGRYECSRGYLKLMENLFWHVRGPLARELTPFVFFISKYVLSGAFFRTYQDIIDMWSLLETSFSVLYNVCNNRKIDVVTVRESQLNITVLTQLLTSSHLLDSIKRTLFEGSRHIDLCGSYVQEREAATLVALSLLDKAVELHTRLREAMKLAGSSIKVSPLDEIFLSLSTLTFADGSRVDVSLFGLICPFVSTLPELLCHTNYALNIMHNLFIMDPAKNTQIKYREAMGSCAKKVAQTCARLTSLEEIGVEWRFHNARPHLNRMEYQNDTNAEELRGRAFCTILEIISHGLQTCPQGASVGSLLLGCEELGNLEESYASSCMTGVLAVIENIISLEHPWRSPYSGLLERCLRVLDRLIAPESAFSAHSLVFFRANHDIIYNLMCFILNTMARQSIDEEEVVDIPLIQGTILNLSAIELSSLAMHGQFIHAQRMYKYLLSSGVLNEDETIQDSVFAGCAPLWYCFNDIALRFKSDRDDAEIMNRALVEENKKFDKLLQSVMTKTTSALPQIDIETLHSLLIDQWDLLFPVEFSDIALAEILIYCVRRNEILAEQSANIHLLTGQLALVNVVSLFAEMDLFDTRLLLYIMSDGIVNYILEFASQLQLSETVTDMITECVLRIVSAIAKLCSRFEQDFPENPIHADNFSVLSALIKYFVNPGSYLSVKGKINMYGAILQMLHTLKALKRAEDTDEAPEDPDPTLAMLNLHLLKKEAPISELIGKFGSLLARCFSSDIASNVPSLRLVAVSCMTEFLYETCEGSMIVIENLVRDGSVRILLESVRARDVMGALKVEVPKEDKKQQPNAKEVAERVPTYVKAVMAFFTRIAQTPAGSQSLEEAGYIKNVREYLEKKAEKKKNAVKIE